MGASASGYRSRRAGRLSTKLVDVLGSQIVEQRQSDYGGREASELRTEQEFIVAEAYKWRRCVSIIVIEGRCVLAPVRACTSPLLYNGTVY